MKIIITALALIIIMAFTTLLFADEREEAQAFFDRIGQQDLIIDDVSALSFEELSDMVQTTHNYCRYGKALRLQNYRDYVAEHGSLKSSASQNQTYWDAKFYKLDFAINFSTEIISGYTTMQATSLINGLTEAELDLYDNMTVDSVKFNGGTALYSHNNDLITVAFAGSLNIGQDFTITVYYHGHPIEGGFQAFSFSTHSGVQMATTLSEPYFARTWWPCKDYPEDKADSVEIVITHPFSFVCASNGIVQSIVDNGDGTKTTTHKHRYPIATYLVAIGVTNYSEFSSEYVTAANDTVPVDFYVFPEKLSSAQNSYPILPSMLYELSQRIGEYPFGEEKYGMLHFDWGGAMEHQTNTSMSYTAYYESIIVHELGHQWYGDMITCDNWHEIWMNEGFASYIEALWFEATDGVDEYHDYMNTMRYTSGGTIYCQDTTTVWSIFSSRVYDKGAWVVHMLRNFVGDETFFNILTTYYDDARYKWKSVTTTQFRDLCIDISGDTRLNDFFQDWIWGEYYPIYRPSFLVEEYAPGQYVAYVHIRQTQTTNPTVFHMPVELSFTDGITAYDTTVYNDESAQNFVIYLNSFSNAPNSMTLDPLDWILCNKYPEPYKMHLIYDPIDTAAQFSSYSDSVIVRGGTEFYTITVTDGSLPDGLELDEQTGMITGIPNESGEFVFTVTAFDGVSTEVREYTLYVTEAPILIGDANYDDKVNISDAVYLINYVFSGGLAPQPILEVGDANCDSRVNVSDAVYIINYVFNGGGVPGDC